MRSDGKKNSCFRLVFIEFFSRFDHTPEVLIGSFSRFRRFYWIIFDDSFCAFGAILLMLLFPIYIIRCKMLRIGSQG